MPTFTGKFPQPYVRRMNSMLEKIVHEAFEICHYLHHNFTSNRVYFNRESKKFIFMRGFVF